MHGVTQLMYEGTPEYPQPNRYWAMVEKHGITVLYTTPTALRMYMKFGNSIPSSFESIISSLIGYCR